MSVDIGGAMERGFARVTTAEGGKLVAIFVAVAVIVDVVWETILGRFVAGDPFFDAIPTEVAADLRQQYADYQVLLDIGVPVSSLIALVVLLWILQFVLRIGAKRWFVGPSSNDLSADLFTKRIVWTVANLIVGLLLYTLAIVIVPIVLVFVGLLVSGGSRSVGVLAALPGLAIAIFLAVALYFYTFEIIVEGENAIDGLANSYALTAGDRLELFLIGIVFTLLGALIGVIGVPTILPGRLLPVMIGAAATAAFGVYTIATAADVYRQLQADDEVAHEAEPAETVESAP